MADSSKDVSLVQPRYHAPSISTPRLVAGFTLFVLIAGIYSGASIVSAGSWNPIKASYIYAFVVAVGAICLVFQNQSFRLTTIPLGLIVVLILYAIILDVQMILYVNADTQLFIWRLQFVSVAIFSIFVFASYSEFDKVITLLRAVVVFSSLFNVVEFLFSDLVSLSSVPGRAAGLYGNPTISATMIAAALPLITLRLPALWRNLFFVLTFTGIFVTFSRSGLLLWAIAVFLVLYVPAGRKIGLSGRSALVLSGQALLAIVIFLFYQEIIILFVDYFGAYLDANTSSRLLRLDDDSALERMYILGLGWDAFTQAPLFGQGLGYTWTWEYPVSVHNQVLITLAEQGMVGGVWLVALAVMIGRFRWPFGWWLLIILGVASLFTHNLFDSGLYALLIVLYWYAGEHMGREVAREIPSGDAAPLSR